MNPSIINTGATSSSFRQSGAGIVQEIDAAAMSIWISYKHYEGGVDCAVAATACANGAAATATKLDLQDLNLVKFGALINF